MALHDANDFVSSSSGLLPIIITWSAQRVALSHFMWLSILHFWAS